MYIDGWKKVVRGIWNSDDDATSMHEALYGENPSSHHWFVTIVALDTLFFFQ
jgi:hypothetical protein